MASLSDAQWKKLQDFWVKNVEPNLTKHGHEVLVRMFVNHKSTLEYFPKFRHLTTEAEMRSNEDIRKHGNTVFTALGKLLKLKGNVEGDLRSMADSHANKHKIQLENFDIISKVIDSYFHESFPGDYGADVQDYMKATLALIVQTLTKLYKELGK